ncbi:MAG: HAD-IC family P-type ATPase, partial [Oscillospiraceae bacterium]
MFNTNLKTGLSEEEARRRVENGQSNSGFTAKTKSISQILFENIFTLFNLINIVLAALVFFVGSFRNALFIGVVVCNTAIGIYQEIRAKRAIDKLSVISEPKAEVLRDGIRKTISADDVVIGDIMLLSAGMQICADGIVRESDCEINESLITGESDAIYKTIDSEVFSGSYVSAGFVKAEVTRVGTQSMAGRITSAKYFKKPVSDMMNAINKIIRILSVIIIPYGLIMMIKSLFVVKSPLETSVTSTVAALIGMIPEGLVLLMGIALAVSVIRLSKHHTLCRDLYCVEQLARVDVLCVDKTGTLT